MADGKCDKCGALTSNRGNMFQCGSGMVDYTSKGAKLVKTTTSITQNRLCVLCDNCISEYAERLKKGKGNYTVPIIAMILTAVIGGLFSLMGGVIRVICFLGIAIYWGFAARDILKIRKESQVKSETVKNMNPLTLTRRYEREAEMEYMKRFHTTVTPIFTESSSAGSFLK